MVVGKPLTLMNEDKTPGLIEHNMRSNFKISFFMVINCDRFQGNIEKLKVTYIFGNLIIPKLIHLFPQRCI